MKKNVNIHKILPLLTVILTAYVHSYVSVGISASHGEKNLASLLDGSLDNRWTTQKSMAPGMWFMVRFSKPFKVQSISLDAGKSRNDFPRSVELYASMDGEKWGAPIAKKEGQTVTRLSGFNVTTRYLKIVHTGSFSKWWSIHELKINGKSLDKLAQYKPAYKTYKITQPKLEYHISGLQASEFGVAPNDNKDDSEGLQFAVDALVTCGGGTLYLPSGVYEIHKPVAIPSGINIQGGNWKPLASGYKPSGTIFHIYHGKGDADAKPALTFAEGSGMRNITFWYPEQQAKKITPYGWMANLHSESTIENINVVNAYKGFLFGIDNSSRWFIRNLKGTFLKRAFVINGSYDIGRLDTVELSPRFWKQSGFPGSPEGDEAAKFIYENGIALNIGRIDWSYFFNFEIEGYNIGLDMGVMRNGKMETPNGQLFMGTFKDCHTALNIYNCAGGGSSFSMGKVTILNAQVGIALSGNFTGLLNIHTATIQSPNILIQNLGTTGKINLTAVKLLDGTIIADGGFVNLSGCEINTKKTPLHIKKYAGGALLVGNKFLGNSKIINESANKGNVRIEKELQDIPAIPDYPYRPPVEPFTPKSGTLYNVLAFGAKADGKTDTSPAIKAAIAKAKTGGGIVFFPKGKFAVRKPITVPPGVELRGLNDLPRSPNAYGSIIYIYHGKKQPKGTATFTMLGNSGMRGVSFHYPDQIQPEVVPYTYTIRGKGPGIYLINLTATCVYNYIDFAAHRCDRHYFDYISGGTLKTSFRIGKGCTGGRIYNCQLNPSFYTFNRQIENNQGRMFSKYKEQYKAMGVENFTKDFYHKYEFAHHDAYVIGDAQDEILHNNFVFGAKDGIAFINENGKGTSGYCLGHGSDQSTFPLRIEKLGMKNYPMVNMQLVTVSHCPGEYTYVRMEKGFDGIATLYNSGSWGAAIYSYVINGGTLYLMNGSSKKPKRGLFKLGGGSVRTVNCHFTEHKKIIAEESTSAQNNHFLSTIFEPSKDKLAIVNNARAINNETLNTTVQLTYIPAGFRNMKPSREISSLLGPAPENKGLVFIEKNGESKNVPAGKVGERHGWKNIRSFFYFKVDDYTFEEGRGSEIILEIDYFDQGDFKVRVVYDSSDQSVRRVQKSPGAWKAAGEFTSSGSGEWKTARFEIDDALFEHRCNGSDLRLECGSTKVVLGAVRILRDGDYEEEEENDTSVPGESKRKRGMRKFINKLGK